MDITSKLAREEILALADVDPELKAWQESNPPAPDLPLDAAEIKQVMENMEQSILLPNLPSMEGLVISDDAITARDGYRIPVRIYKPQTPPADGYPLVVSFHGGGFLLGSTLWEERNCRKFVVSCGVVCVGVDYRLTPDYKFPYAVNDCWDVVQHLAKHASVSLPVNLAKGFILEGSSAGGNLADVIGHLARDEVLSPPVTGLLEIVPALCDMDNIPTKYQDTHLSMKQNGYDSAGIMAEMKMMNWMIELYIPDKAERSFTLFSSLLDPKRHAGMPPVFIQAAGLDPLRDQALIYREALQEAGVRSKLKVYKGLPHNFHMSYPHFKASEQHEKDSLEGLRWLLNGGEA